MCQALPVARGSLGVMTMNARDHLRGETAMTPHVPEELSARIDWNPFAIMGNTMPPRDPDEGDYDEEGEDEDEDEDEENHSADEPPFVREPDED
jgi:hypothetical protein